MSSIKIKDLPAGVATANSVVPSDNATGTTTEKITLAQIRDLPHNHTDQQINTTYSTGSTIEDDIPVYNIGNTKIVRLLSNDPYTISGLTPAPEDNTYTDMRILSNVGNFTITFAHVAAPAVQQIRCVNNTNYTLQPGGSVIVYYDHVDECWRLG